MSPYFTQKIIILLQYFVQGLFCITLVYPKYPISIRLRIRVSPVRIRVRIKVRLGLGMRVRDEG